MTRAAKIYYVWLVLCNVFKIMSNVTSTAEGQRIIDSAYNKRKQLGISFIEGMDTTARLRDIRRMVGSLMRNEVEEPF